MPNGIDWQTISRQSTHPLEKIKPLLRDFARANRFKLHSSTYHDGLYVEFFRSDRNKKGSGYLRRAITLGLAELEGKLICRVSANVDTHYGWRELFYLLPFVRQLRGSLTRKKSSNQIGVLDFPIDSEKLSCLLEQAKQTLYRFNE